MAETFDGRDPSAKNSLSASFSIERGRNLLPFFGSVLAIGLPVDLLTLWLTLRIHDPPTLIALFLVVAPVAGALFGWIQMTQPPRRVEGKVAGLTLTLQNGRVIEVPWETVTDAAVLGPPIWTVRIAAVGLPTLYGVALFTYPQARAIIAHPSFPEVSGLEALRARLGIPLSPSLGT